MILHNVTVTLETSTDMYNRPRSGTFSSSTSKQITNCDNRLENLIDQNDVEPPITVQCPFSSEFAFVPHYNAAWCPWPLVHLMLCNLSMWLPIMGGTCNMDQH